MTGWWTLEITGVDELNDIDREHIARAVEQGYTSGENVQFEDELEDETEVKDGSFKG